MLLSGPLCTETILTILPPPPLPASLLALEQLLAPLDAVATRRGPAWRSDAYTVGVLVVEDNFAQLHPRSSGLSCGFGMVSVVERDRQRVAGAAGNRGNVQRLESRDGPGLNIDSGGRSTGDGVLMQRKLCRMLLLWLLGRGVMMSVITALVRRVVRLKYCMDSHCRLRDR